MKILGYSYRSYIAVLGDECEREREEGGESVRNKTNCI